MTHALRPSSFEIGSGQELEERSAAKVLDAVIDVTAVRLGWRKVVRVLRDDVLRAAGFRGRPHGAVPRIRELLPGRWVGWQRLMSSKLGRSHCIISLAASAQRRSLASERSLVGRSGGGSLIQRQTSTRLSSAM